MLKILSSIFPFFDHLYIFQTLEYEALPYLKWFIRYPLSRDLQKKHRLEITQKALLLTTLALLIIVAKSFVLSKLLFGNYIFAPVFLVFLSQFSAIFILFAKLLTHPLEIYQKNKIINTAKLKIKKSDDLKRVAIVGSYAKTSTKDILYTLLTKKYRTVKTPKSYNTPLSVARSILELVKENTEILIAEMDAYHPGEIDTLAKIVKPDIGIITAIASQHLERFGSMDSLAHAQFEIAENLPENGTLFLNDKDDWSMKISHNQNFNVNNKFTFGLDNSCDFYAADIKQTAEGLKFNFHIKNNNQKAEILLPLFGEHHVLNFVSAAAIATTLGLSLDELKSRALKVLPTPHRLEIRKNGNITIIDNTYNTNPTAVQASLKLLKEYPGDKKILITPGLVEQGENSREENIKFMETASKVVDEIVVVGENAKNYLLEGLKISNFSEEKIHLARSTQDGLSLLSTISKPNSVVLLENDLPDQYN